MCEHSLTLADGVGQVVSLSSPAVSLFWIVASPIALTAMLSGCVPEGPPSGQTAPPAPASASVPADGDPLLSAPFADRFERDEIGDDWRALPAAQSHPWRIVDGELCVEGAKNRGIWLKRRLPSNARITFYARSDSPDGDIKAELWGDGRSGATGVSYDDATSYLVIFGGWKNSRHVLARLREHGDDARINEVLASAEDPRQRPVAQGQTYFFRIERSDGRTLRWYVDDELIHEIVDTEPLAGEGHDHIGFNNWTTRVCFDDVEVTPL